MGSTLHEERIKEVAREAYGDIARRFVAEPHGEPRQASCCSTAESRSQASCCGPVEERSQVSCCGPSEVSVETSSAARLYEDEELSGLPDSVTQASLGCGNPTAIAGLRRGEVVLDLGSGGGIDSFLAARQVGPEGRVIGLDMTPDMIKLARRNAKQMGVTNVDFRYGEMEEMPLPGDSVDVIISNCVINLSPDKDAVFREAYRVLRPGGRMSISDMVVDGDLPQAIRGRLDAWAACVAGALDEADYLGRMRAAGFEAVEVQSRAYADLDDVLGSDGVQVLVVGPDGQKVEGEEAKALLAESGLSPHDLAHKVASIKVTARKPL
jgi:arsenite methyltransferase